MLKDIQIKINNDGIWSDTSLDDVDTSASENELAQRVANAVAKKYGYAVEVTIENIPDTKVLGLDEFTDSNDIERIKEIIADIWATWDWVIDK